MNSKSVKEGGKHNMYSKSKRFIASFLAVLMAVCMLPAEMFGGAGVAYAYGTAQIEAGNITLGGAVTKGDDGSYTAEYTGNAIEPTVTLADVTVEVSGESQSKTPELDTDYAVSCTGNTAVGEATVTVTAKEGTDIFAEDSSAEVKFTITKAALKEVTLAETSVTAGSEAPTATVKTAAQTLTTNDYDLAYTNKDGGATVVPTEATAGMTVVVTATPKADSTNYDGSASAEYTVTPASPSTVDLTAAMITVGDKAVTGKGTAESPYVADGLSVELNETVTAATPAVVVKLNASDENPVAASEYTATYADNTAKGTATVTVKPADNSTVFNASATGIVIQFTVTEKEDEGGDKDELYYDIDLSKEIAADTKAAGDSLTFLGKHEVATAGVTVEGVSYDNAVQCKSNATMTDGIPTGGAAIKFEPTHNGVLTVALKKASGKTGHFLSVTADGTKSDTTIDLEDSKICKFDVKQGNTYYLYLQGSKPYIYSLIVDYRTLTSETMVAPEVVSAEVSTDNKKFTVKASGIVGIDAANTKRYADSLIVTMTAPDNTKTSQKISAPNTSFDAAQERTFEFKSDTAFADGTYTFTASLVRSNETSETVGTVTKTVTIGNADDTKVAAPTADPETTDDAATAAEKTVGTKVALSSDTQGATIVYAISKNGTAPEDSAVTIPYTGEIELDTEGTTIIKAQATKDSMTASDIVTFVYKVVPASPQEKYDITVVTDVAHAEVVATNKNQAAENEVVKLIDVVSVDPENGWKVGSWTVVKTADSTTVPVSKNDDGDDVFTMPAEGVTVTPVMAEVQLTKYTVKLVKADGTTVVGQPTEVEEGANYTFPAETPTLDPADDTKYFAGWQDVADTSDEPVLWNPKEVYGEVNSDLTFKEVWKTKSDKKYTVTFVDWYGNVVDKLTKTDVEPGTDITIPDAVTKKTGYEFKGWYLEGEGTYKKDQHYIVKEADVTFEEELKYIPVADNGMEVRVDDAYYTGKAVKPEVEVYYNGYDLIEGDDYTVKYKNNVNADGKKQPFVTVTGKNNYAGAVKKDIPFTIIKADIWEYTECTDMMTVVEKAKVSPLIVYNGKVLKLNKDFTLSGTGLENGKYTAPTEEPKYNETTGELTNEDKAYNTLKVTGTGNFKGEFNIKVRVISKDAAKKAKLGVDIDKTFKPVYGDYLDEIMLFTGSKPKTDNEGKVTYEEPAKVKVYVKGDSAKTPLTINKDYMVIWNTSYESLDYAGTIKFTVVGIGAYTGNVSKSFKISPKKLAAGDIVAGVFEKWENKDGIQTPVMEANPSVEYYAKGAAPYISVYRKVTTKVGDKDVTRYDYMPWDSFKISYSGNKKLGNAKAKITFIGDYKGSPAVTVPYTIVAAGLNSDNTYAVAPDMVSVKDGKACKAKPMVYYDAYESDTLLKASDYTLSYEWASASKVFEDEDGDDIIENNAVKTQYASDDKVQVKFEGNDTYAKVRIKITPKGKYAMDKIKVGDQEKDADPIYAYYKVWKKSGGEKYDLSKAKVEFFEKYENGEYSTPLKKGINFCDKRFYTPDAKVGADGKVTYEKPDEDDSEFIQPVYVKVTVNKTEVVPANLYSVKWFNSYAKGKATVIVTGKGAPKTSAAPAPKAGDETGNGGEGGTTTPAAPTADYAVGSRNATLKINSIGKWIDPVAKPSGDNPAANLLKKFF